MCNLGARCCIVLVLQRSGQSWWLLTAGGLSRDPMKRALLLPNPPAAIKRQNTGLLTPSECPCSRAHPAVSENAAPRRWEVGCSVKSLLAVRPMPCQISCCCNQTGSCCKGELLRLVVPKVRGLACLLCRLWGGDFPASAGAAAQRTPGRRPEQLPEEPGRRSSRCSDYRR